MVFVLGSSASLNIISAVLLMLIWLVQYFLKYKIHHVELFLPCCNALHISGYVIFYLRNAEH